MESDRFGLIRQYFTHDAWEALSDIEKQAYCNMKSNYEKLTELGIAGQPPSFMRAPPPPPPRPARPKRPRVRSPGSGDDDWSPSRCVRPAQRRSRSTVRRGAAKSRFQPPVKRTATVTSAETAPAASSAVSGDVQSQDQRRVTTEEAAAEEADRSPHRPPSPPYDFIGFTLEDQYKARHAVDTKAELLWNHIIAEFKDLGEEPPEREVFKRRRNMVNYREEEDLDDDDYIFCDECDREWEGDCPVHGPLQVVPDTKVPFDTGDPERDIKTRPEFLNPGRSKIPGANTGIWTEKDLPARLRFGPYEGIVTADRRQATDSGYSWEIKKSRRVHHYVNAGDSSSSNWLRLVNCARFEQEQNLIAFQYKGQMYYRTYKPIVKGSELLVYYGDAYARELNINVQTFRKAPATAPPPAAAIVSGGSTVRCVHCDYACLGQERLDRHVKTWHGHIGRNGRYKCEWCEYSTNDVCKMSRHRLTHTGERPHRCDECGRTFTLLISLTAHRRIHTGQRPFVCDACGKAFTQNGALTRHRRIHTGEKVRQCEQCGAVFNILSNYTRHMRSHSGVKPHRCQVCSARFVIRQHLTTHMRTHTGERPYGCSFCPARFAVQSVMRKHVTIRHTHDYRHRCERCGKGFVAPGELRKHSERCSVTS
ncbi:histone-lysine N-methyltransferase PRDM9-like isoform X2 [Amphibalanus amphitrite]|uniref:histone-lysine N-methyltransferase PRDM9-like isoform X2 n=1 Tax=Amphibalanus amphitrite TaxID=1232801 RepID=UPI001C916F6E|nr:histone-lysine N-methyltransferase PRDM9-like isoform X2 [Amphibalanus amphitrite]